jgi:hypothetical protein
MKNLLVVLGVCFSLSACVAETESSEPEDETEEIDSGGGSLDGHASDKGGFGCESLSYVGVTIAGHHYWVRVPTLCDDRPYIFKGDPGPDRGDPYDDRDDPVTREEILEKYHEQHLANGGNRSSTTQQ